MSRSTTQPPPIDISPLHSASSAWGAPRPARNRTSSPESPVVVVRYEGPKGGPGMRETLSPTSAIKGRGLSDVALLTDGRFAGGSHGFVIGHASPEAIEAVP